MLGKGLESLIPQKGSGNNGSNNPPPPVEPQVSEPRAAEPRASEPDPVQSQPIESRPVVVHPAEQAAKVFEEPVAVFPDRSSSPSPEAFTGNYHAYKKEPEASESVFHIEVDKITPNPDQPRRHFDETALRDLAHSIREYGFLQPLVVSRIEHETPRGIEVEYQLIAGERRLLASKLLGLTVVPAIVRKIGLEREKLELAVIENIQRENLDVIETARAFQRLQEEFRMTQREIASKLGKSREVVANTVRLLDLPEYVQIAVSKGELSESNARFLLSIEDPGAQKHLFEDIIQNRLTTRDVKEKVKSMGNAAGGAKRGRPPKSDAHLPPELRAMQESLSSDLGAPVEIQKNANNGKITITFYSEEELENILRRLGKE